MNDLLSEEQSTLATFEKFRGRILSSIPWTRQYNSINLRTFRAPYPSSYLKAFKKQQQYIQDTGYNLRFILANLTGIIYYRID